ncbi:MAG: Rieske 2Fe-2S domain-containing protein [Nitrospirae bacterium]|nr:Rieske 2Fe-2S domain-containing protein [Nitrospirota bacterium]
MRRVCIGRIEDVPDGEGRAVTLYGRTYAVFREGDRLFALENRCPHAGGPLADGFVGGGSVTCPLHGWKVDLRTGKIAGGLGEQVRVMPVIRGEEFIYLEVDLPYENQQTYDCACGK